MRIPKPILERRRSIRIDESLPFKIGASGFELEATSLNISNNGAMCLVAKDLPLMTKLSMAISLDSKKTLCVHGVVVRKEKEPLTGEFRVAVFFSDMTEGDRTALNRFMASRIPPAA